MTQQAANITTYVTLEAETCCNCGMAFGIPSDYRRRLLNEKRGQMFYCPAGHPQHYTGKTEAERLRDQLAAKEREVESQRARAEAWIKTAETSARSAAALRGVANRIRKRVGNGVCPCCQRTFTQLGRHMTSKHPGFATQDIG